MALPTWVAGGTFAAGVGDVSPGVPAGYQADDIFLLFVESNADQAAAAPSGYAAVPDSPQFPTGAGGTRATCFWRRATGSESAPTVTDTGNHTDAIIHAFRGCITTGDPWDVTSGGFEDNSDTSVSIPGDTTTVADCLVVLFVAHGNDATTANVSDWTNADLANLTERSDDSTDAAGGGGIAVATGEKASAGAYGATTATLGTGAVKAFMSIALKPPTGGGVAHNLAAVINGAATVTAALSLSKTLAAVIDGSTAVTASLTVGSAAAPEFPVFNAAAVILYLRRQWRLG